MGEYKDLLDEIKSSNRETFKEIDFKKFMRNDEYVDMIIEWDEEKLKEQIKKKSQKRTLASKLERLKEHKVIVKEKNISLSFSDSTSDPLNNLKNWLRYRIIGSLRKCYFNEEYDCDECYKRIVSKLEIPWDNEYVDNIFSVATLFFEFIRTFLIDHKMDIDSGTNSKKVKVHNRNVLPLFYKEIFGRVAEEYRDAWILMNIGKLYDIASKTERKVFGAFDKLCKYTHTFGNYMPCPDGDYNGIKGSAKNYFKDNIYLLRNKIKMYDEWFDENSSKYYLDILWKKDNMILPNKYADKDLSKYLEECSNIITKRSDAIFEKEIEKRVQVFFL